MIIGNRAEGAEGQGGGAYFDQGGTLLNSTLIGNIVVEGPGTTLFFSNGGVVQNSIVWSNTAPLGYISGNPATLTYNCIQGWAGGGEGNINTNPAFVGPGDYHLQKSSPCKNHGSNSAPDLPTTDMEGRPRIIEGVVDLGAYEYGTLTAAFLGSPQVGPAPLSVLFTSTTWGQVLTYLWDFGDGNSSTASNPTHIYQNPGKYSVVLTVTGPDATETLTQSNYIEAQNKKYLFLPLLPNQ